MAETIKKTLRKEYNRLKKVIEKINKPASKDKSPQLILQPYQNKKKF
jgi:hypothetical protein